jgi:Predicted membrane protein
MELSTVILVLILAAAVLGHADSVAVAVCILLLVKLLRLDSYIFPFIKDKGMFWGVVLLVAAILIPIANGQVKAGDICNVFTSWIGITAIALSFLTTYLSGIGLKYLTIQGHTDIMPAMILGAVGAAAFMGGVPVGPLITSGILAVIAKLVTKQ